MRYQGFSQKLWANYLFHDVDHLEVMVTKLDPLNQASIEARIAHLDATSYVKESNEDGFKASMSFQSFYYQAQTPISDRELIGASSCSG